MLAVIEKAIESRDIKQLDVIPQKILRFYLSQLPEDKRSDFESIKRSQVKVCHNPNNPLWDISFVSNGDRVRNKVTGKIGIATIYRGSRHEWSDSQKLVHKEDYFTTSDFIPTIDVKYQDGTEGSVYPNQIERI